MLSGCLLSGCFFSLIDFWSSGVWAFGATSFLWLFPFWSNNLRLYNVEYLILKFKFGSDFFHVKIWGHRCRLLKALPCIISNKSTAVNKLVWSEWPHINIHLINWLLKNISWTPLTKYHDKRAIQITFYPV